MNIENLVVFFFSKQHFQVQQASQCIASDTIVIDLAFSFEIS
jgi:hypothetical protein